VTCQDCGEPTRCEADHTDGGVCSRVLWSDGTCPGAADHDDWRRPMVNGHQPRCASLRGYPTCDCGRP